MNSLRQRALLLVLLVIGLAAWRGGFGFFAFERTVVLRLPTAYADVRSVDVQLWSEADGLLKRQVVETPKGLSDDPRVQVPLRRGAHRVIALARSASGQTFSWQVEFDPGWDEVLTVSPGR